ncbi:Protein kinase domain [Macleaya cordata]|uniref:Serine/threonine-protein kinase PRP4 homolog n=1 Tax=Macleaya cordata TaxID=56857 RepID=A0A200Q3H4_MACCD|nr:Protein kinase domain [Macleaya cordata]
MAGDESDVQRKHHRSPEDEVEEDSKRRKHSHRRSSHRHHHHHHHRHRSSKHDHEKTKQEGEEDGDLAPQNPPLVIPSSNSRPDDDKEEGEILDEEDFGVADGKLAKKKSDSDVESGEIESDEADDKSDNRNLGIHGKGENIAGKTAEQIELNLNALPENDETARNASIDAMDKTDYRIRECSDGNVVKKIDDEVDIPQDSRTERLVDGYEPVKSREKKVKKRHGDSSSRDGSPSRDNGNIDEKSHVGDTRTHGGSRSAKKGSEKERNYKDVEADVLRRRGRSRSPLDREDLDSRKYRKVDDRYNKSDHVRDAEEDSSIISRRPSESIVGERNGLGIPNKSVSPVSTGNKYKSVTHSPSYDRYNDEAHTRSRSMSRDHVRERRSLSRTNLPEGTVHHHEWDANTFAETSERVKPANSRENAKDESDRERVGRHGREDRRRDRERSSSYSRHSGREERHHSWDTRERDRDRDRERDRERGRDRERSSSYSRPSGREERHHSWDTRERDRDRDRERDRERGRDRERSSSYSRPSGREERHGSRGDQERDRERERGRERDIERLRDKDRNRASDRDRDRDRDRGRDRIRERERDMERNKDGHMDFRRPRYDESERYPERTRSKGSAKVTSSKNVDLEVGEEKLQRDADEQENYEERVALKLAEQEEEDIDRIKEESRKRRQAILEKYKQQQLQQHVEPHSEYPGKEEKASLTRDRLPEQSSLPKAVVSADPEGAGSRNNGSDVDVADPIFSVGKSPTQNGTSALQRTQGAGGLGDGTPKSERSADMFCDDIFGESPAGVRKLGKGDGLQVERSGLNDNWDDAEGYYSYRFGEILDGRYEVTAAHGKGVFSTVVRAKDLKAGKDDPEEVAIKIIRNNDTMYKAGQEELVILKKLAGADPEDRRHCVRFLSSFKYRNHLCLVFESLHMNLREVLKKFGRNIGLKLTAVRAYAKQLFIALKHLRNCGVLHCDIKPDNMLVNEAKNVLKLCDFGNAMFAGKNEITPYLVSRFYRAPEIILGLSYDHPMDIWSVGCCLYELYSGKVLFPGPSNNDMLRLHMELKGTFPKKMLRKGAFTDQHFDQDLNFHATEEDPVTKKTVKRLLLNIKPKDIGTIITSSPGEDPKMLANFKDLLERIFVLDPDKRMTLSNHWAFICLYLRCTGPRALDTLLAWKKCEKDDVWSGDLPTWRFFQWDVFCFYWFLPAMRQPIQCFRCLEGNQKKVMVAKLSENSLLCQHMGLGIVTYGYFVDHSFQRQDSL